MAFVTSGLTAYVKENENVLIKDIVLGTGMKGSIISDLNFQTGVKTSERIHYMDTDVVLQSGGTCGFSASGDTEFNERTITTGQFKVNSVYCPEDLLSKFNESKVKINANGGDLPYEAEVMDAIVLGIDKQMEILAFQGDKSGGDLIDGLLTQAKNQDSASTIVVTASSGASAYDRILGVYMQIPEEIVDDAVIFVSPSLFRSYIQDLVNANLYHYNPEFKGELTECFLPGSSVVVRKAYGLTNSDDIYCTSMKNLYAACDMENSKEEIKLWFSDDDDVWKLKVRYNFGVATLWPDMVIVGEI